MTAPDRATTFAVYCRSEQATRHFAALQTAGVRFDCVDVGTRWTAPRDAAGLLWELSPEDGAQRLVAALIADMPAASFSVTPQAGLDDLSRTLGFRAHLTFPLTGEAIEEALGLGRVLDLADRIDAAAPRVIQMAARPETLGAVMRAVNVAPEPVQVAKALAAYVADWLSVTAWHVFAVEPDGLPRLLSDADVDAVEVPARTATASLAEFIVRTGQSSVRVPNYLDDRIDAAGTRARQVEASVVGWPLVVNGAVVGALVGLDAGRARRLPVLSSAFSEAMVRLLEPAAYALANALRVVRAEALSVTDDLTQLFNSRYLNDVLRKETKRAMRSGWPLSLLFIDLDGFKDINDANGHLLGSRALIEAADIIRTSARETDIVARFGGDEFAILLPETGVEGAHSVARRLRDRIQRFHFLAGHDPAARLTASIGVATLPDVADTAEGLLHAADTAMYRVKSTGKNGIHIAGSENKGAAVSAEEEELR